MATKKELQLEKDIRIYNILIALAAVVFVVSFPIYLWFTNQVEHENYDYKELSVTVVDVSVNTRYIQGKFFRPTTETIVMVRNGRFNMQLHNVTNDFKYINALHSGEEITVYQYRG